MRTKYNKNPRSPYSAKKALREMEKYSHLGDYGSVCWKADFSAMEIAAETVKNKHVARLACLYSLHNLDYCYKEVAYNQRLLKKIISEAHPLDMVNLTQYVGSGMTRELWLACINKSPDGEAFKHARGEISWDLEIAAIAVSKHCELDWGWENTGEGSLCWNMTWYTRKQFRYGKPSAMAYLAWLENKRQGVDENLPWYTDEDGLIWGTLDEENEFKWS